jgi:PAS domain S-box-containing protein
MLKEKDKSCIGWQETFDAALDIFALISNDFKILKINQTGCKNLGMKREELIGRKCFQVVHGLDSPIEGCPCKKALETGDGANGEIFDHGRYYLTTASPILDKYNKVYAFAHTVKDITEQKKAEEKIKNAYNALEQIVEKRTAELIIANRNLKREIEEHKKSEKALISSESELKKKKIALENKNMVLGEIIAQIEIEKSKIKEEISLNVERIIYPLLDRLHSENGATTYIKLIRNNLENLTSSYGKNITKMSYKLTPREIELCNMIKSGLSSKDISKVSNISIKTVDKHRRNIRKKLDITKRKINLTSLLREF